MRPWLASSFFVLAATAHPVAADTILTGSKVKVELQLPDAGKEQSVTAADFQPRSATVTKRWLSGARCQCDRATAGKNQHLALKLTFDMNPNPVPTGTLDVYAGDNCDTATAAERPLQCSQLGSVTPMDVRQVKTLFVRAGDVLAPGSVGGDTSMPNPCDPVRLDSDIVVVSGSSPPLTVESSAVLNVTFDLKPPHMADDLTAAGLDGAIKVKWSSTGVTDEPKYFQALCAKSDGTVAHPSTGTASAPTALFDTTLALCGAPATPPTAAADDGVPPDGDLPVALEELQAAFTCGEASNAASEMLLEDLENGQPYWVVVLAIDEAGNYDARYIPHTVSPVPSIDFWEDANQDNPDINGGFCVAQVGRGGSGSASGALLVLAAIVGAVRRRRRNGRGRARGAALLGLGLLALAPTTARAQDYDPYWIDSDAASTDRVDQPQWHLGLRLGPYHPSVDDGYSTDPGPFRRMFGPGYNLVPQLDLHRLWTVSTLQLGIGISGGYYRKSADAYQIGSSPTDPMRPRSVGATNTFNMVPLSVTGIARLAVLDDRWGIPVVPYVRGGLAYNVWWVRTATGELAMTDCDTCKDKALGASAGLVGAVGIAIRGERLDGEASHSMRNGGVEHAGFYAELETSWVDGFGSGKRLSLGDTTWYAGVDFEF